MNDRCLTADSIAKHIGAIVEGDGSVKLRGVSDLEGATNTDISFFANPRYHQQMMKSCAGVIILSPDADRPVGKTYLLHKDPSAAFQAALMLFRETRPPLTCFSGIHPSAVVHPSAILGLGVTIGPHAVIDGGVVVGERSFIGANVYVGPQSRIGSDCCIHPNATLREGTVCGNRVIIQPGAVIGSCGFGYITDARGRHTKLEQLGSVYIADDVEIGANTTIDRARFQVTRIGEGTKIDNQVQVAHNVEMGNHCLIVSQAGIAGSTRLGNHVVLGGQVAVNGHIELVDGVRIAACSGVSKSLLKAGEYGGVPVQPIGEYNRNAVLLRKIGDLFSRLKALESKEI